MIEKLIQNPPELIEAEKNALILESCKVSLYDSFQAIICTYMSTLENAMIPVQKCDIFLRILTTFQNEFVQELLEADSIAGAFNSFEKAKVKIRLAKDCYLEDVC